MTPTIHMSAPSSGDAMDITVPASSSALPSAHKSPEGQGNGANGANGMHSTLSHSHSSGPHTPAPNDHLPPDGLLMPAPTAAAAAAVHQPKIVQTAFIHKLYNMLEDKSIQHLISWTPSAESFIMQPTHEFSRVLAQYFKHTNISSFVRQLNMYGFHKVNDVFHSGAVPDATQWEFKHGNGSFRRGDLMGLREIKRRASRHALVTREFGNPKVPPVQLGMPAETFVHMPDAGDPRVAMEHNVYDFNARMQRAEENAHYMHMKQQAIMDTVSQILHFNRDLARAVLALAPSPDNPIHQDVANLQGSVQRQMEVFRALEEPPESLRASRGAYFAHVDNVPVSPRQLAEDDPRRWYLNVPRPRTPNCYRPTVPSNLSISTRRPYGSMSANPLPSSPSPSPMRIPPPPPPPPGPHPLSNVEVPPGSLARRHTSADIRAHGWPPNHPSLSISGSPSIMHWPSSPGRGPPMVEDQRIRDSFPQYTLQPSYQPQARPVTPPLPPPPPYINGAAALDSFGSWSWNKANRGENKKLNIADGSAPPTRRGSMAHILNPTNPAAREDEDEMDSRGDDDRKRKRLL